MTYRFEEGVESAPDQLECLGEAGANPLHVRPKPVEVPTDDISTAASSCRSCSMLDFSIAPCLSPADRPHLEPGIAKVMKTDGPSST